MPEVVTRFVGQPEQLIVSADRSTAAIRKVGVATEETNSKAVRSHTSAAAAASKHEKELGKLSEGAVAASAHFTSLGRTMAYASGAFVGGEVVGMALKGIVDAALNAQKTMALLDVQLKNVGASSEANKKNIEDFTSALSSMSGFKQDELIQGFTRLLVVTKNVGAAHKDLSLAVDVARQRHIELSAAVQIVTKEQIGMTGALRRMGIDVKPVTTAMNDLKAAHTAAAAAAKAHHATIGPLTAAQIAAAKAADQHATAIKLLAAQHKSSAGAAKAYGDTSAGAMDRFSAAIQKLQEHLGAKLLPLIASVAQAGVKFVGDWDKAGTTANTLHQYLSLVADSLVAVAKEVNNVAGILGGWKTVIEGVGIAFATWKLASLVGTLVGVGKSVLTLAGVFPKLTAAAEAARAGVVVNMAESEAATVAAANGMRAALIATGWGALAVAAGLAAAYVITHWGQVKKWFHDFWVGLQILFRDGVDVLEGTFFGFIASVVGELKLIADAAAAALGWVPGVGGKLKAASKTIDSWYTDFKNRSLSAFSDIGKATADSYASSYISQIGTHVSAMQASTAAGATGVMKGPGGYTMDKPGKNGIVDPTAPKVSGKAGPVGSPMGAGLTQGRVDAGVDYGGQGAILAIDNGVVTYLGSAPENAKGGGGPFMIYKISGGRYVYVAEKWTPAPGIGVGTAVKKGQVLGHALGSIEIGWAAGPTGTWNTLAGAQGYTYPDSPDPAIEASGAGKSFSSAIGGPSTPTPTPTWDTTPKPTKAPRSKKPKVDPSTQPASALDVAKAIRQVGDEVDEASNITEKKLREHALHLAEAAKSLLDSSHPTKGDLAKAKDDIAQAQKEIAEALSFDKINAKASKDIAGMKTLMREGFWSGPEAKKVNAEISAYGAARRKALADGVISPGELSRLTTMEGKLHDVLKASARAYATEMSAQAADVKKIGADMAKALGDAAQQAGLAVAKVMSPADIQKTAERIEKIKQILSGGYIKPGTRAKLEAELAGLEDSMNGGLGALVQAVNDARSKMEAAWSAFSSDVLAGFDAFKQQAKDAISAVSDSFDNKELANTIARSTADLTKAAVGDPQTAALVEKRIQLWKDYYKALSENNLALAGQIQDQIITTENAIQDRIAGLSSDQQQAAQTIVASGDTIVGAVKTQGEKVVAAVEKNWDTISAEQRKDIEKALADAQAEIEKDPSMLPDALQKVKNALLAAGMNPDEADALLKDPMANAMKDAVKAMTTAIGELEGVLRGLAKALGITLPDPTGALADSVEANALRIATAYWKISQAKSQDQFSMPPDPNSPTDPASPPTTTPTNGNSSAPRIPPAPTGGSCFVGETLVNVPGGQRRIDSLAVGDLVCVYDFDRESWVSAPVSQLHVHEGRDARRVRQISTGRHIVRVTDEHPFWDGSRWVAAGRVLPGQPLATSTRENLRIEKVKSVVRLDGLRAVYNITVDHPEHNYCAAGFLVHNVKMGGGFWSGGIAGYVGRAYQGMIVPGTRPAPADEILARVTAGEMILSDVQQRHLYNLIDGGGGGLGWVGGGRDNVMAQILARLEQLAAESRTIEFHNTFPGAAVDPYAWTARAAQAASATFAPSTGLTTGYVAPRNPWVTDPNRPWHIGGK